jgi:hypothetical protein
VQQVGFIKTGSITENGLLMIPMVIKQLLQYDKGQKKLGSGFLE